MQIYLIRHAAAVKIDNEITEDSLRYLSPTGRSHSFEIAKILKGNRVHFDIIYSSPLVRALQTAEIFANVLHHKGELKTAVELIGGASFNRFKQMLKRNTHHKGIACFGHSPDVNHFAIGLINNNNIKELKLDFKNCSVCKISYDAEREKGSFIWFLKSDTMELIKV